MASDPTLLTRQAIVEHLRADAGVLATPMADRFYGERAPKDRTWPFGRYGQTALGQLGGTIPLHFFSKQEFTDEVAGIMAAVVESLGNATIVLGDGRKLRLSYPDEGGSQIIPDAAESDAWHGIVRLEGLIARECAVA